MLEQNRETRGRLLATLTRDLLAAERFETLADLTETLKCRCARLRISWTNDDITVAFRLIASNTALVTSGQQVAERPARPEPISRAEASRLYHDLRIRLLR